jgi:hypothetical protein
MTTARCRAAPSFWWTTCRSVTPICTTILLPGGCFHAHACCHVDFGARAQVDYASAAGFTDATRYKRGSGEDGTILYALPNGIRNVSVRGFAMEGSTWSVLLLAGPASSSLRVVSSVSSTSLAPSDFSNGWAVWSVSQELPSCPTHLAVRMTGEPLPAAARASPAPHTPSPRCSAPRAHCATAERQSPACAGSATVDEFPGWGVQISRVRLLASGAAACSPDTCSLSDEQAPGALPSSLASTTSAAASVPGEAGASPAAAPPQCILSPAARLAATAADGGTSSSSSTSSAAAASIAPAAAAPAAVTETHDLLADLRLMFASSANLVRMEPSDELPVGSKGRLRRADAEAG